MGSFKISSTECVNLDIELEEQQQKLNRLWKWAEKHGANLESIKAVAYRQKTSTLPPINYSSSIYRGVIAVHEKREFDLIADIPESILLTESVARGSPVGVALTAYFESIGRQSSPLVLEAKWITAHNNNIRANGLLFIIVFMVYQQFELERDEAFYSPYLDSLPISYTTVPLFWTLEEMKKYIGVGTNLLNLLVNRLAVLKSGFELVHAACSSKFVKKPKALSWENFLWAYVSISSRAFPLLSGSISAGQGLHAINSSSNTSVGDDLNDDLKRDPTEVCMWPILDMFNHKLNQKIEWSTLLKPQHVSYIARDVCKVGEEINSNYGPKGNEMFLGAYGFVIDPNPNDYFKLTIQVSERDLLAARKRKLLEKCCISKSHLLFEREKDIAGAGEEQPIIISKSLMSALRVFCMNEHELTLKECDGDSKVIEPINPRNELSVLNALFTLMSEKLELIEQTIDIKASTGDRYSELDLEKIRMGRVYRDGQKRILKQNIEAVIRDAREFLSQKVGGTAGSDGVEIIQLAIKQTFLSLDPRLSTLKCSDLGQDTEWIKMLHDGAIRLGYEELIDEDCLLALALARLNKNLGCHSLPRDQLEFAEDQWCRQGLGELISTSASNSQIKSVTLENFLSALDALNKYDLSLSESFLRSCLHKKQRRTSRGSTIYGVVVCF